MVRPVGMCSRTKVPPSSASSEMKSWPVNESPAMTMSRWTPGRTNCEQKRAAEKRRRLQLLGCQWYCVLRRETFGGSVASHSPQNERYAYFHPLTNGLAPNSRWRR